MSDIDINSLRNDPEYWDAIAPEGATHYDPDEMEDDAPWLRLDTTQEPKFWNGAAWCPVPNRVYFHSYRSRFIERPAAKLREPTQHPTLLSEWVYWQEHAPADATHAFWTEGISGPTWYKRDKDEQWVVKRTRSNTWVSACAAGVCELVPRPAKPAHQPYAIGEKVELLGTSSMATVTRTAIVIWYDQGKPVVRVDTPGTWLTYLCDGDRVDGITYTVQPAVDPRVAQIKALLANALSWAWTDEGVDDMAQKLLDIVDGK